jgi:hypothetical protein
MQKRILLGIDKVLVGSFHGIELGVRVSIHWNYVEYGNIIGENLIQLKVKVFGEILVKIEVEKVLRGMNLGIGSSTANASDFILQNLAKCFLKNLLHRNYTSGLPLPTSVVKTLKTNVNKISHSQDFESKIS